MFTGVHVVEHWVQRALVVSTALVLLAVLMAPPMAFGITMTPADPDELISADDPYLYVLIGMVATSVCALFAAWWTSCSAPSRRRTGATIALAALSSCCAGAIVCVAVFDLIGLALG